MKQLTFAQIEASIAKMNEGTVILTSVRPVSGDKYSVEFAEKIVNETSNGLLGNLNFNDERFTGQKARRGWTSATKAGLAQVFGINVDELKSEEHPKFDVIYPVGLINPMAHGKNIRLQIVDKVLSQLDPEKDAWKLDNVKLSAKQDGKGNYFIAGHELIFSDVIPTDAKVFEHSIITRDSTTTDPESYLLPNIALTAEEKVGKKVVETAVSSL